MHRLDRRYTNNLIDIIGVDHRELSCGEKNEDTHDGKRCTFYHRVKDAQDTTRSNIKVNNLLFKKLKKT